MADPAQAPSFLSRMTQAVPEAVRGAVDPVGRLRELLRQMYAGSGAPPQAEPTRPAPIEGGAPTAPTQGPAQGPRPAPRPAVPAVTSGAAAATQVPSEAPKPSLLDTLRETVQQEATPRNSAADSLAAFAAGMTSSGRRQGFVQDLLAGIQAQNQFETGRRGETRQSAEAQARLVEADRKAVMEKAKLASEAPYRDALARQALAHAGLYERMPGTSAGRGGGGELTPARLAALRNQALQRAINLVRNDIMNAGLSEAEVMRRAQAMIPTQMEIILQSGGGVGGAPAETPASPAVPVLDPARRPVQ